MADRKHPFGSKEQIDPREAQRRSAKKRKENRNRLAAIAAAFDFSAATREELELIDRHFLVMTKRELMDFARDESKPADLRARARQWLHDTDTDGVAMGEAIRNRAFGKPKQTTEIDGTLQTEQTMIFTGLPDPSND